MFCNRPLRQELGLRCSDPTDPQAEVLEDSVIEPRYIMDVAVQSESAQGKLAKAGVGSSVEPELFRPRADHLYWKSNRLSMPDNDYPDVLAFEQVCALDLVS